MDQFSKKHPSLVDKLPKHFGFGIGYEFREKILLISPKNENRIKRGNAFAVITSFKDINNGNNHKYSMHTGDTVFLDHENKL